MYTKRWKTLSCSVKNYVILVTLIYVIRFVESATTNRIENFEEEDLLSDPSSSPTTTSQSSLCQLITNSTLDCSNLGLSEIPKDIPNSVKQLNLSHNSISNFLDDAFDKYCVNITLLDLSYNDISNLSRRHFERLKSLETLFLLANKISSLSPDTFVDLKNLKRLDLSSNSLELQGSTSEGFLISSSLEELNLDNCGISELPTGMFSNMTQLQKLTLTGNLFDNFIDTTPFEPLQNLLYLRMNRLSKSSIYILCEKLQSIDTINFDEYNVSCLVLSVDGPFEGAIIPNDVVEEPKSRSVILPTSTTRKPVELVSITTSTIMPSQNILSVTEISTASPQPELEETPEGAFTAITNEAPAIDIDIATIKFILLGIFVFTILGILIGLVCRADVCGIKTKLCRTKKTTNNRRTPTDTVSPFEEIPLNSVNGKTTELQV